jgi:hypothetical protein
MNSEDNRISVYNGREWIGGIIQRPSGFDAFDLSGVHLGMFPTVKAAAAAVSTPRSSSCVRDQSEHVGPR